MTKMDVKDAWALRVTLNNGDVHADSERFEYRANAIERKNEYFSEGYAVEEGGSITYYRVERVDLFLDKDIILQLLQEV